MTMSDRNRPNDNDDDAFDHDENASPEARDGEDDAYDEQYDDDADDHQHDELDLGDEDDSRLPWLEGDDEDYETGGSGQLIAFVLGGLALLAALVAGIWWFTRDDDGAPVADGSVVEAPAEPYKERPVDADAPQMEGTGDSSFAVSEGQAPPAQLGTPGASDKAAAAAEPGFASVNKGAAAAAGPAKAAPASAPAAAAPATAPAAGGVGVQVGAYSSRDKAEAAWSAMTGRHSALSGLSHRVVEGQADIGKVYRLQAVAADSGAASALCRSLRSAGQSCMVK